MFELIKKLFYLFLTIVAIMVIGYGAYVLYHVMIEDATKRIKTGVSEGVSEGVGKSLNPFKMIGGVLGGGGNK